MNPEPPTQNLEPGTWNVLPQLRFALQEHDANPTHWDLFLERDGTLKTWSLSHAPSAPFDQPIEALQHFDHRLLYLTYEGEISGGRGSVRLLDSGTCEATWSDSLITLHLHGNLLRGTFELAFKTPGPRALWIFKRALNAGLPHGV